MARAIKKLSDISPESLHEQHQDESERQASVLPAAVSGYDAFFS